MVEIKGKNVTKVMELVNSLMDPEDNEAVVVSDSYTKFVRPDLMEYPELLQQCGIYYSNAVGFWQLNNTVTGDGYSLVCKGEEPLPFPLNETKLVEVLDSLAKLLGKKNIIVNMVIIDYDVVRPCTVCSFEFVDKEDLWSFYE